MVKRRTKIVATLGPACDDLAVMEKLIAAGVDIVRLNFSHGVASDHALRVAMVRKVAKQQGKEVAVLADLQGPKIRIAKFKQGKVNLESGAEFILDADLASDAGDEHQVGIDYKQLPGDLVEGDTLLFDDGRLVMGVQKIVGNKIICQVEEGGELSNNKGINRQGGGLSAEALTEKDKRDLITAVELEADYIAISFPRSAADIEEARALLKAAGGTAGIIAKIERAEAIPVINEIIDASDGVMVARGDLGVEIGDAELPAVQKMLIHEARVQRKTVIVATQMMESMIHNAIPTRAEVFDVANAVLDGSDAVMLSAETATGQHPVRVVEAMDRICLGAEKQSRAQTSKHRIDSRFSRIDEAIAMATMYTANHLDIKAIITLTESGSTPLWMSRIRSGIPIYALCRDAKMRRKMALYRGVYPIEFDVTACSKDNVNQQAIALLVKSNILEATDIVLLTKGDLVGTHGGTNAMKIIKVS